MTSKCRCDNACIYCNEYADETGKNDYCDYAAAVLTKDRKFFISIVGCVSYMTK